MTCFQKNLLTVLAVLGCLVLVSNVSPELTADLTEKFVEATSPLVVGILQLAIMVWAIMFIFRKAFGGGKAKKK